MRYISVVAMQRLSKGDRSHAATNRSTTTSTTHPLENLNPLPKQASPSALKRDVTLARLLSLFQAF